MSKADEQWHWVDEDPIDKLLRASHPSEQPEAVSPESPYDRAVRLEKEGQRELAAVAFLEVLDADPEHAESMLRLGACLLSLGSTEEGLSWFERSLAGRGPWERALFGKAVALQKMGRLDEADTAYQALLRRNPAAAEPLANLIALSVARDDLARVTEYSRRLLDIDAESKPALQGLAMVAIRNGDQRAAVDYCTRLVQADPDCFEGWFNLRFAEQKMRPPEAARSARSIA